ncbi:MAG: hypothetical protein HN981_02075 [Candidatus Pacebacteria bacterium]|nr:hypothetical protein [Candidatus Paceibacterota bacterium]MBT4652790.1 hypothetical protein [Candidatus Paceibacterota bacterium]MBT6755947.1 hypothetical protein [Candidatus Paceibacterota bacterium]MBT6921160.1 hypothetical protein [Candidatus Paceibacterota bacterium]
MKNSLPPLSPVTIISGKSSQKYTLSLGITEKQLQKVVNYAQNDPLIIAQTSDPSRFSSLTRAYEWIEKEEKVFFTISPEKNLDQLSGIVWFEKSPLPAPYSTVTNPEDSWTFGIRIYESARGNKLSFPFMDEVFKKFWELHPKKSVWLSTRKTNLIAQKIYKKFGFTKLGTIPDKVVYLIEDRT